jgi:hypothetical protein
MERRMERSALIRRAHMMQAVLWVVPEQHGELTLALYITL